MAWYLNRALTNLRNEVNARWPNRDKTSDGTIGDAAHQSTTSDHNPDSDGSVDAWDMDVDGVDVRHVIEQFEKHEAARYWIYNRQIASRGNDWRRERYTGSNPHDKHVHFNTREGYEDSTKPWGIGEDEMDQATFNLRMVGALRSPTVASMMRSLPWAYLVSPRQSAFGTLLADKGLLFTSLQALDAKLDAIAAKAGVDPAELAEIRAGVDEALAEQAGIDQAAIARTVLSGLTPEEVAEAVADTMPADEADETADLLHRAVHARRGRPEYDPDSGAEHIPSQRDGSPHEHR